MSIERIVEGYLEAGIWSTHVYDEQGDDLGPMDEFFDIDDCTNVEDVEREIRDFVTGNLDAITELIIDHKATWEQIGHDFLLTRDGHGCGFWDRGYGEVGRTISAAARIYGDSGFLPVDWENYDRGFVCEGSTP